MDRSSFTVKYFSVVALLAVICGSILLRLLVDPVWAGVYGSWFGGIASFSAVAAALWIAFFQKNQQDHLAKVSNQKRSKLLYYRANRYCTGIVLGLLPISKQNYIMFFEMEQFRGNEELIRGAFSPFSLHAPRMQLDDLTYVDDISLELIEIYDRIDLHEIHIKSLLGRDKGEAMLATYDMLFANVDAMKALAIRVSLRVREFHSAGRSESIGSANL